VEGQAPAPLTRIADALDLNPSTAYNILRTLTEARFLSYDPATRTYELGLALQELAGSVDAPRLVHEALRAELGALVADCGHTGYLFRWDPEAGDDGFVVVERRDGAQAVRLTANVGQRFPASQRICAKTYFAWWPVEGLVDVVDGYALAGENASAAARRSYLEELAAVRRRGYAVSSGEAHPALSALGVPVFDGAGRISHLLVVAGLLTDLTADELSRIAPRACAAAAAMTAAAGGRAPTGDDACSVEQ
jgi:DNA-binding IclR family transcriptional regulator